MEDQDDVKPEDSRRSSGKSADGAADDEELNSDAPKLIPGARSLETSTAGGRRWVQMPRKGSDNNVCSIMSLQAMAGYKYKGNARPGLKLDGDGRWYSFS